MSPKYASYKIKRPPNSTRKCWYCGHTLSKFNPNKYCWIHTMVGFELEQKRLKLKKDALDTAYRLKMKKEYQDKLLRKEDKNDN